MKRANILELSAVVAVAKHRSFRRAALEVGVSASSVSHAISTLEARMGVRLFNRTTRSVAPTEAGERFLLRLRPALDEIDEAINDVDDYRERPSGTVRLNLSEGAAHILLEPVILEFMRRYPDVHVDLVTESRFVDIVAEGFDAGVRSADHVPQDMLGVICSPPIRFLVVGAPSYFAVHPAPCSPDELTRHTCIRGRLANGALYPWEFLHKGEKSVFSPQGALTLDNHNLMIRSALKGAGLIWTAETSIEAALTEGALVPVLEEFSPQLPPLKLYYSSHRHLPAAFKAFIGVVREATSIYDSAPREWVAAAV